MAVLLNRRLELSFITPGVAAGFTIKSENIIAESMVITRSLCDGNFKLGGCIASSFEIQLIDVPANKVQGKKITAKLYETFEIYGAQSVIFPSTSTYPSNDLYPGKLHQLRGRVQRGSIEGSCYLLTDSKDDRVIERLNVLCKTNNGFEIAREDLRLRGPGDMLGTRQSGLPAFVLGNIVEDTKFIEAAKKDAREILERPEDFKDYLEKITKMASNLNTD